MASYDPPSINSNVFNDNYFTSIDGALTIATADLRYLKLTGGIVRGPCTFASAVNITGVLSSTNLIQTTSTASDSISTNGSLTIAGVVFGSTEASYLSGLSIGVASVSKALVLNSSGNISGVNSFGANSVVIGGQTLTSTEAAFLTSQVLGTAQASKALVVDSSKNISNLNIVGLNRINISGLTIDSSDLGMIDSVTAGTVIASKAMVVDASKNLTWNGNLTMSNTNDSINISNTSTTGRSNIRMTSDVNFMELGIRGSANGSNPGMMYIYFNSSYKALMNTTGDLSILSSTDSNNARTAGSLVLSGGLSVTKTINANQLALHYNGSQLVIKNDDNAKSALIEVPSSGDLRLLSGDSSYYAVNIGSSGVAISSSSRTPGMGALFPLDFGNTAQDCIIKFYTGYFIGANNSALQFSTGGDHTFWNNGANTLGTKLATIHSSGNVISQAGCHANSFSTAGLAGYGGMAHMHFGGGVGSFISYNYGTGTWLPSQLGPQLYVAPNSDGSKTGLNINSTSTSYLCPLQVSGSALFTRVAGSFGYLANTGAGQAAGFTNRPFSAYFDSGLLCAANEINCFSDVRVKKDIDPIPLETAKKLLSIEPISFRYKAQSEEDTKLYAGFRAQDFVRRGLEHGVGLVELNGSSDIESEDIKTDDGRVFHLPADMKLVLNQQELIPLLTRIIQDQEKRLSFLERKIESLEYANNKSRRGETHGNTN